MMTMSREKLVCILGGIQYVLYPIGNFCTCGIDGISLTILQILLLVQFKGLRSSDAT